MALLDCAINKKCCTVDGGWGICPLFPSYPGGFASSRIPTPGNLPSKAKKNANSPGVSPGGGGWAQVELTDAKSISNRGTFCNFSLGPKKKFVKRL